MEKQVIVEVSASINSNLETVWLAWTSPEHIINWNAASEDWHTPRAENDLRVGGSFLQRMESKDGSMGFDFKGTYTDLDYLKHISYIMEDGRKVEVDFSLNGDIVFLSEKFDAESINEIELQRIGWQSILNNFKNYVEQTFQ